MKPALSLAFHGLVIQTNKQFLLAFAGLSWASLTYNQRELTNIINTNKERHGNKNQFRTLRSRKQAELLMLSQILGEFFFFYTR